MKINVILPFFILSILSLIAGETKQEEGKDWIKIPAISDGLCVNNLFQSNMVLQRDKPVKVWGWAAPGEELVVTFAGQSHTAKVDKDRHWKVTLTAMEANTRPQVLTVKGKNKTLTFENILVGDIWLLGGQSNMEHPIARIEGGKAEIQSANFPNIRHMTTYRKSIQDYQKSFPLVHKWDKGKKTHKPSDAYWQVCSPETIGNLSGIGYIFIRRLHMATQVPIGVIDTSIGGTTLEAWTPFVAVKAVEGKETKRWVAEQEAYIAAYDAKKELEERAMKKKAWLTKNPTPCEQCDPH